MVEMFERLLAALIILALLVLVMFIAFPDPTFRITESRNEDQQTQQEPSITRQDPTPARPDPVPPTEIAKTETPPAETPGTEPGQKSPVQLGPAAPATVPNPGTEPPASLAPAPTSPTPSATPTAQATPERGGKEEKALAPVPMKVNQTEVRIKPQDRLQQTRPSLFRRYLRWGGDDPSPPQMARGTNKQLNAEKKQDRADAIGDLIKKKTASYREKPRREVQYRRPDYRRTDYRRTDYRHTRYDECPGGNCNCRCEGPYWSRARTNNYPCSD